MSSEETPLLHSSSPSAAAELPQLKREAVYSRFSSRRKRTIVALVSWTGLLPFFVAGSFLPLIPQIAKELDSTGPIISLAVSLSILATAIGSLSFATYSTFYGRRPVYLYGLPLLCLGSLGVAMSRTISQLMVYRFIQAFGASGGLSVGTGAIGDIYKLEERGTAMGVFFAACLLGPALAPLAGGVAAQYSSWRDMQYALFLCGLSAFVLVLLFLPETSHPGSRGIDKMNTSKRQAPHWKWVWLNPFSTLLLLRSPNLMAVTLSGTFVLLSNYVLIVPLAYTIGERYHITNQALVGACFLPCGIGNLIGAPLAGWMSDRTIISCRAKRGGKWVPEDRLRATLWGGALIVPLSVLFAGLVMQYLDGTVGLVLNLVCLFWNGVGVDLVLSPSAAYNVDVMHSRSAEIIAANTGFRSGLMSLAIACILPLVNLIGVAATNALSALLAWVGFVILWCTIRYGDRMRAWIDVGYSTVDDN